MTGRHRSPPPEGRPWDAERVGEVMVVAGSFLLVILSFLGAYGFLR